MSNAVKELRQKLNLSQAGFAREMGVCRQMIWRYEVGKAKPSIDIIKRMIDFSRKNNVKINAEDFLLGQ
jgi:DNA-binding XRE family transcriptional regulator